jgi:hypothetical protein
VWLDSGEEMWRSFLYFFGHCLFIAILLTLCDYYCHTYFNVLYYHSPQDGLFSLFPNHPTSIIFMNFFGIGIYCTVTGWFIFRQMKPLPNEQTIFTLLVFVLFYYLSGYLQSNPMFLNNLFLIVWGLQLVNMNRDKDMNKLVLFSILLGVLGPVVEGYYSGVVGFFAYNDVDAYYVPCWLCGLYLNGALAIAATTSKLESWRIGRVPLETKQR